MMKVLVTGMSGTGKSSALAELGRRGYRVVDTDDPGWTEWVAAPEEVGGGGWLWVEDRVTELARLRTRDNGRFRVRLRPGRYGVSARNEMPLAL